MDFALLRRRTAEVDRQHREAMATIDDDLRAAHFGDGPTAASRRRFLTRAGAGAAVAVGGAVVPFSTLVAAAQEPGPSDTTGGDATGGAADATTGATDGLGATAPAAEGEELSPNEGCETAPVDAPAADVQVVRFAESVERAAVAAYELADERRLLQAQPAESARIFGRHHADHAEALYCLVPASAPMEANQALVDLLAPQITAATTADELANVLYGIEEGAAATYMFALGVLESPDVAGAAASILPIEAQHAVVWGQVLGLPIDQWMPAFQSETGAFDPAEYAS